MNTDAANLRRRLNQELEGLRAAGIAVTDRAETDGAQRWTCTLRHDETDVSVSVTIVDGFPWLAPTVTSDDPLMARHQTPDRDGPFCLDRDDSPWWHPEHSIAQLLQHLQALLDADSSGAARVDEADMPEPASAFLSGSGFPVVFVPATLLKTHLGATSGSLRLTRVEGPNGRWIVTRLRSADGGRIALSGETQQSAFKLNRRTQLEVEWKDLGELRDRPGVEAARRALVATPEAPKRRGRARPASSRWRAITFMEEGPTRAQTRRAWVFADLHGSPPQIAWAQALSVGERGARRAQLRGLGDARVAVFGVGAIGSAVAFSLAQAGITDLQLIDADTFDVNNGVRHVLPAAAAGQPKATALAAFLNGHQPFCQATGRVVNIGYDAGSVDLTTNLIADADLVIDATGAPTVSRMLGAIASEHAVPTIHAALLAGATHGYVFVRRTSTGCIDHFLTDPLLPLPDTDALPHATPFGCSHPAVSCAPFEPAELAIHAARIAAQVLPTASYSSFDHDWLITQFASGTATYGSTAKHTNCAYCDA